VSECPEKYAATFGYYENEGVDILRRQPSSAPTYPFITPSVEILLKILPKNSSILGSFTSKA
jgi:hypothetical protein